MDCLDRLKRCYARHARAWHALRVLMWKHYVEHKHSPGAFLWRVIQGCSAFLALLTVNISIIPTLSKQHENNSTNVSEVFFTPRNNVTEMIMMNVRKDINMMLPKIHEADPSMLPESYKFNFYNSKTVLNDSSEIFAMVDFEDLGLETDHFVYSITTFVKEPTFEGPIQRFFYELDPSETDVSNVLGLLQWTIDKTYIGHLGNRNINHDLQLFPRQKFIKQYITKLHIFIHFCIVLAPMPFYLYKTTRMSTTRRSGFLNLLKLTGISQNIFRISHALDTAFASSVYAIIIVIMLKVTSRPLLPYSNVLIIAISIILYFVNVNCIAFLTSTMSTDVHYGNSLAILVYLSTVFVSFMWFSQTVTSNTLRIFGCCFLPHTPIFLFFENVIYREKHGNGLGFSEIHHWNGYHLPVIVIWLIFLLHLICLITLDWYLVEVMPSRYGVTREWNFIFQRKMYHKKKKVVNFHVTAEQNVQVLRDSTYFQEVPRRAEVAVKVTKLTKEFKSKTHTVKVLDKICLDFYKGEVTVILGNHGSGKSVLMCIMSGMQTATSGKVYVNGMDNFLRISAVKDMISFCPQQTVVFKYLTVKENIIFFEKMRKMQEKSIADELITLLQMNEHEHSLRHQLSKGMCKCLQMACSVASGAEVLIFDDPTYNMGIAMKHRVWDLIMKLRGQKTIIMSTTLIEEASALGDRIAILNKGKVRCYGSPSFLIDAIGIGLNLTITLQQPDYLEAVKSLVVDAIPDVTCDVRGERCVTFLLPHKDSELFLNLIDTLEEKKAEFTITSLDVGASMEAVYSQFMDRFAEELDVVVEAQYDDAFVDICTGWRLVRNQFRVLIRRIYDFVWMKKYQFIFKQVLLPVFAVFVITLLTNPEYGYGKFTMKGGVRTMIFDTGPYVRHALNNIADRYGVTLLLSKNVERDLKYLPVLAEKTIGISMSKRITKMFIPENQYALSQSVNIFSNLFLNLHMPMSNKRIVTNYRSTKNVTGIIPTKPLFLCLNWSVCISFCTMLTLAPFIMLAIIEGETGTRDIHMIAGCSALVHWCSKLIAHMSLYIVIVPTAVILAILLLDFHDIFNNIYFLGVLVLILVAFALAFLTHLQFLSFILNPEEAVGRIYLQALFFGIIMPVFIMSLQYEIAVYPSIKFIYVITLLLAYFSPLYVFSSSLYQLVLMARVNKYCVSNRHLCPNFVLQDKAFSNEVCCKSTGRVPFSYFDTMLCINIAVLIIHAFLYMTLVILLQKRTIQHWFERMLCCQYKPSPQMYLHPTVKHEKARVRDRILIKQFSNETLIAHKVCKSYYRIRNKSFHTNRALQGITFLAKKGECIGILGPTGAGKSTLLRTLAGCITMTSGTSWVAGYNIASDYVKYIRKIGLVCSTGEVDRFYTGRENLELICQLTGYSKLTAERMTGLMLQNLGLTSFANTLVDEYNISCWRRLLLCVVFVLNPEVAFLDEPMNEVDRRTKAIVARALGKLVDAGTTIIIAEPCLDWHEMETIYNRMAIIYGGQFICIGPAKEVVQTLTSGFSVYIKLSVSRAYWTSQMTLLDFGGTERERNIEALKDDFKTEFPNSIVAEESVCMLFFYIKQDSEKISYSTLFAKLALLDKKHESILESYTFNRTTVEEVFWRIPHLVEHL